MRTSPLALSLVLAPTALFGANVTVDSASDFNSRAARLCPGDELVVQDGVYSNWTLQLPCKGAHDRPIVVRPHTPGGVLFRRATSILITGAHIVVRGFRFEHCGPESVVKFQDADRNRLTDCRFLHCGDPRRTFRFIVQVYDNSHHNRVDHCTFVGSKSMSLVLYSSEKTQEKLGTHNRFDHNLFRDIFALSRNGQEPIMVGRGGRSEKYDAFTIIEHNVLDNASGDSELFSNKSDRNTYRYNVAAYCKRAALSLRGGRDCLVEGNILVGSSEGVRIHGVRHRVINNLILDQERYGIMMPLGGRNHRQAEDCLVAHNTVVNSRVAALAFHEWGGYKLPPKGNRIVNNIFVGDRGALLPLKEPLARGNTISNNLLWATGAAKIGFQGRSAILADPRLLGAMFVPAKGAPGIDGALTLPEVTRDRRGLPRPVGNAADIGADEAQVGAVQPLVTLPPIPLRRPPFDIDALKAQAVFAMDSREPPRGWAVGRTGTVRAHGPELRLTDSEVWLGEELPDSFVAEWQYRPAEFASKVAVRFAARDRSGGYVLRFGGIDGKLPNGIVTLSKGPEDVIVADGNDVVKPQRQRNTIPVPKDHYRCRLVKQGGRLRLEIHGTPVLLWHDTGVVQGSVPGAGAFGIKQTGSGAWQAVKIWRCRR